MLLSWCLTFVSIDTISNLKALVHLHEKTLHSHLVPVLALVPFKHAQVHEDEPQMLAEAMPVEVIWTLASGITVFQLHNIPSASRPDHHKPAA